MKLFLNCSLHFICNDVDFFYRFLSIIYFALNVFLSLFSLNLVEFYVYIIYVSDVWQKLLSRTTYRSVCRLVNISVLQLK